MTKTALLSSHIQPNGKCRVYCEDKVFAIERWQVHGMPNNEIRRSTGILEERAGRWHFTYRGEVFVLREKGMPAGYDHAWKIKLDGSVLPIEFNSRGAAEAGLETELRRKLKKECV